MGRISPIFTGELVIKQIATALSDAALDLDNADHTESFLAAIEDHKQAWLRLCQVAAAMRLELPERILRFSLAAPQKARHGLSDHEVETLVQFDRLISDAILEMLAHPGTSGDRLVVATDR